MTVQAGQSTHAACQVTTSQSSMRSVLTGISTWTLTYIIGILPVRQQGGISFQASSSPGQALATSNGKDRHLMKECGRQRCRSTCPVTCLRGSLSSSLSTWPTQRSPRTLGCMSLLRTSQTLWESLSSLGHLRARQCLHMRLHGLQSRVSNPMGCTPSSSFMLHKHIPVLPGPCSAAPLMTAISQV